MKFSELSTDKALDVLCELTPYISNITEDNDLVNTLDKVMDLGKDLNMYGKFALLAGRVTEVTPILLKTHRADVYGILAAVNERSVDDIAAQPVMETMRQVRELFQDSGLTGLFKSSAPSANGEEVVE